MKKQGKIVVVFNQKGGAGKTTTTCNLAGTFGHRGFSSAVADLDLQRSATMWIRAKNGANFPGIVVDKLSGQAQLYAKLKELREEHDLIFIDCAPQLESDDNWAALLVADIILIPTKLNATDISALPSALRVVKRALAESKRDIPVLLVPVAFKKSESDQRMALTLLEEGALAEMTNETRASRCVLGDRVPFKRAAQYGATAHSIPRSGDAIAEIESLADEVAEILSLPALELE